MAEVLQAHDFRLHGNGKYPWHEWGNGDTWRISHKIDFQVEPRVMQGQIKVRGGKEGRKTATNVVGASVIFTFQRPDETEAEFVARTKPAQPES